MKRIPLTVLAIAAGASTGCKDLGLSDNIPLEEARYRQPSPLVAAVMAQPEDPGPRIIVDGRLWVPSGRPLLLGPAESAQLRPVGSGGGETVYARSWDTPPYRALFTRLPHEAGVDDVTGGTDRWIELAPVRGRSGPVQGAGAAEPGAAAHPADSGPGEAEGAGQAGHDGH